jgi:hypothetical protein
MRYDEPTVPDEKTHATYNEAYAQYRALYPLLKDMMHGLNKG